MTILMEDEQELDIGFDYENVLRQVIEKALELEKCPYECEVNVTFTDNEGIRNINREFRELDVPTDVLSFPMVDYEAPADYGILESDDALAMYFNPESVERAFEQAENYGHSIKREICFLTAHSMLHLLGYDHMEDEERIVMEKKQEEILNALGIKRDC